MASNAELKTRVEELEQHVASYDAFFQSIAQQLDLEVNAGRDEVQAAITELTEAPTPKATKLASEHPALEDDGSVRLLVRLDGVQYSLESGEQVLRTLLESSALNVKSVELIV